MFTSAHTVSHLQTIEDPEIRKTNKPGKMKEGSQHRVDKMGMGLVVVLE